MIMMNGFGYGMGWWMLINWIIIAVVLVFALYGLITLLKRSDSDFTANNRNVALDIIKERLARGEIQIEEYHQLREELLK